MAFVTDGSTSNMNTTATTISPAFTPTAATWHTYRVGLVGDMAYCYIDGILRASHGSVLASRVEGGALLRPWIFLLSKTVSTTKIIDIDYIYVQQDRSVIVV
jgi:hypothetical protein